jgi:probable HAF family extracellular repeat protein
MKKHLVLFSAAFLFATLSAAFAQTHAYIWDATNGPRDLGSLGGDSFGYAINDSGSVVGEWFPPQQYQHGFIWTEATGMVDLGIPGGGDSSIAECRPTAINSAGHVVGYGRQVDGQQVAFFWTTDDGFTILGDLSNHSDNGNTAYAINDLDQVTGNLLIERNSLYHAYLWSPGMVHPRDIGALDGEQYSLGNGINNHATIVGGSLSIFDSLWQPITWKQRTGMRLLGAIDGSVLAWATAINDAGQVIGLDQTGTADLAFYTDRTTGLKFLKGLGGNSTYAVGLNQQGVIVGAARDTTDTQHAVMWSTPTSRPTVLPLEVARGINNLGQVVGDGQATAGAP